MSSQLMTNKAQALDMQSHLLVTLDEVKDKWRSVHVQLSGQLHSTTEWSQSLRAELTSKADKALGKVQLSPLPYCLSSSSLFRKSQIYNNGRSSCGRRLAVCLILSPY